MTWLDTAKIISDVEMKVVLSTLVFKFNLLKNTRENGDLPQEWVEISVKTPKMLGKNLKQIVQ